MRKSILVCWLAVVIAATGCSAFNHGKYQQAVLNRYVLVDTEAKNFGYKYMGYEQGFRAPIKGYVRQNGYPDFFRVYKEGKRRGIVLFYVSKNQAIDFFESSWAPDSVYPRDIRKLTEEERQIFLKLRGTRPARPEKIANIMQIEAERRGSFHERSEWAAD